MNDDDGDDGNDDEKADEDEYNYENENYEDNYDHNLKQSYYFSCIHHMCHPQPFSTDHIFCLNDISYVKGNYEQFMIMLIMMMIMKMIKTMA